MAGCRCAVLAKNFETGEWDEILSSKTGEISLCEVTARLNYLNLFKKCHYNANDVKFVQK